MSLVVKATPRPLYPREKDPVHTVQEAGWAPTPVCMGAENLAPNGIRSPKLPAHIVAVPTKLSRPTTISYSLSILFFASYNHETEHFTLIRRATASLAVYPPFSPSDLITLQYRC